VQKQTAQNAIGSTEQQWAESVCSRFEEGEAKSDGRIEGGKFRYLFLAAGSIAPEGLKGDYVASRPDKNRVLAATALSCVLSRKDCA
jgi:hypothetical protein